jgi:hypothetical protein
VPTSSVAASSLSLARAENSTSSRYAGGLDARFGGVRFGVFFGFRPGVFFAFFLGRPEDFPACFGGRPRRFGVGVGAGAGLFGGRPRRVGVVAGLFGGRPRRVGVVAKSASTPNAALLIAAGARPRFFGGTFDDEGGRPRFFFCDGGDGAGVVFTSFTASFFGGRPRRFVGVVFATARAFAFGVGFAARFALKRGAAGSLLVFEPARMDGGYVHSMTPTSDARMEKK